MQPIVHTVHLIFVISRETLTIESALLSNSVNPCIDVSRFFPSTFCSWHGETHDKAYKSAVDWLRGPGCHLPEAVVKMVLPNDQPIDGETLGEYRQRLGKPGTETHAALTCVWRGGAWRRQD